MRTLRLGQTFATISAQAALRHTGRFRSPTALALGWGSFFVNCYFPAHEKEPRDAPRLFPDAAALADLCRRRHIQQLALFGSTLKGASRPDSDVDLLVEFEAGREAIEAELSAMLGGRPADPRTRQDLRRYFRDEVERTAEVEYAA